MDLNAVLQDPDSVPDSKVPEVVATLTALSATLAARLGTREEDNLVSVADAAAILNVSRDWVRDHRHALGARKLGRRLLFSRQAVLRVRDRGLRAVR